MGYIQSGASLPTFRPDKGVPLRLGRRGALVHNAETLAHVAMIARTGPEAFRAHGPVEDPGTSLVTISGAVEHPGVVEIDRGTPLAEIAARATPVGTPQALLVGGYGGSWVGPDRLRDALRLAVAAHRRRDRGRRHRGRARGGRLRRRRVGPRRRTTWPSRAPVSAARASTGSRPIADDMARLARGQVDAGLLERLRRRLAEVNGRGACRHPDGAVTLVRSALSVFAHDVRVAPARHAVPTLEPPDRAAVPRPCWRWPEPCCAS